jgi:uncharacterized protein (DUF849 family)
VDKTAAFLANVTLEEDELEVHVAKLIQEQDPTLFSVVADEEVTVVAEADEEEEEEEQEDSQMASRKLIRMKYPQSLAVLRSLADEAGVRDQLEAVAKTIDLRLARMKRKQITLHSFLKTPSHPLPSPKP